MCHFSPCVDDFGFLIAALQALVDLVNGFLCDSRAFYVDIPDFIEKVTNQSKSLVSAVSQR